MFARRFAALLFAVVVLAIAGCGGVSPPPVQKADPVPTVPVADKGPPTDKLTDPAVKPKSSPRPGQISLPAGGGQWPWELPAALATEPTRYATIGAIKGRFTGMAAAPTSRKAVVTFGDAPGNGVGWTRIILCDLATGRVATEWEVQGKFEVIDLSPDGRQLLLRRGDFRNKEALSLWSITDQSTLKRRQWVPHEIPMAGGDDGLAASTGDATDRNESRDVRWAGFAANDRIASMSKAGQFRIFDAATLKPVGSIEALPATPVLTPDGTQLIVLTAGGVALLDPAEAKVVGVHRFRPPEGDNILAVSPDGKSLACTGTGRIRLMDLTTGAVSDSIQPQLKKPNKYERPSFGWAGNKYLLYDELLFDPDFPIPVWRYHNSIGRYWRGREMWAMMRPTESMAVVRGFTLPHRGLEATVAGHVKKPGLFVLRPGDGVRIDVSGIPDSKKAWVQAALQKRLASAGYHSDNGAAVTLAASEDRTARKVSATYIGTASGTVEYLDRPARLKLIKNGEVLWEDHDSIGADSRVVLTSRTDGKRESLDDKAAQGGWGAPDYELFTKARIPPLFPSRQVSLDGFGATFFSAYGLRESSPRGKLVE